MKKLLAALTFAAGAIFGMLFSGRRGQEIRKEIETKSSNEEKAELVGEEAKTMFKNFWNTIRGPLKKLGKEMKKDAEKYSKKYGKEAIDKIEEWKEKASKEIEKDVSVAKKEFKSSAKKFKAVAKKKVNQVKKQIKKKIKKKIRR